MNEKNKIKLKKLQTSSKIIRELKINTRTELKYEHSRGKQSKHTNGDINSDLV